MDRQELLALGTRLKQVLCEVVPEQNVTATAEFCVDSDVVTLSFYIQTLGGLRVTEAREA